MTDILIAILVPLALYAKTVRFGLVVDDTTQHRRMGEFKNRPNRKTYYRHLFYGAGLFQNVQHDHAFTLALNCLLSVLITLKFGLAPALIYVTLPANNQVLVWLNGRRYQAALILGLVTLLYWPAGVVLYPYALFLHVSVLPLIIAAMVLITPWAVLIGLLGFLDIKSLRAWLNGRWSICPEPERRQFHWGKLVMSVKNLADYWLSFFWYPVFSMYHARTWGLVEKEYKKKEAYALDQRFYLSILCLVVVHAVPCYWHPGWIVWALLADICVFQWLGFWKNPVQYWAPRYAVWFYLMAAVGLSQFVPFRILAGFAFFNAGITFSNLEAYRDVQAYFWSMIVREPHNKYAYLSAQQAFAEYTREYQKLGKQIHALQYHTWTAAVGFLWCTRHPEPDEIHEYTTTLINVRKRSDETAGQSSRSDKAVSE